MDHIDRGYNLLANSQRRYLFQILQEKEETTVEVLAKEIATKEGTTQQQARVALVHKHLPKLADHDVVEYDGNTVTIDDGFDEVEPLLEASTDGTQAALEQ